MPPDLHNPECSWQFDFNDRGDTRTVNCHPIFQDVKELHKFAVYNLKSQDLERKVHRHDRRTSLADSGNQIADFAPTVR
jgi:hypothetical protein